MVLHTWRPESGTAHPRPLTSSRGGALRPGPLQSWIAPARKGFLFPTAALSKVFRVEVSRLPHRCPSQGRAAYARPRWSRRPPRLRMFEDLASIEQLGGLYQGPVRRRRPGAGLSRALHPQDRHRQPPSRRVRRWSTSAIRWRDYADGNKAKVMRLDADEFIRRFLLHVTAASASPGCATTDCSPIVPEPASSPCAEPCLVSQSFGTARAGDDAGDDAASDGNRHHRVPAFAGRERWRIDPHSRSATSNVDAGNEDRTSVTMRQSRPRPDINAPITAPRPPLRC